MDIIYDILHIPPYNKKYIKVSNNLRQHWFDLIESDERSVHFPWNEVMFADVFAKARLREELQGKVRLLKERICMTVQVYGSMKYILNIDIYKLYKCGWKKK